MPRRKNQVKMLSPAVLVLVVIASVFLSAGIFYTTTMIIGVGLPPPELVVIVTCEQGNCTDCETQAECEAVENCEWRESPTGSAIGVQLPEGACYEKNVHSKTSVGIGIVDATKEVGLSPADQTPGVKTITVKAEEEGDVSVTVKRLMTKPAEIAAPAGIAYRYFDIMGTGVSVSKVKIDFIVEKSWITANKIDKNTLKVWRAGDATFTALPTTIVEEDDTTVTVRGEASDFSYWAVTGQKGCTGYVSLSLPDSAEGGESVTAQVSGLLYCAGKTVYVRGGSCAGPSVCMVTLVNGGSGSCGFTAPNTTDVYTYYACIDKDGDGAYTGAGESDSATIEVTVAALPVGPVCGNDVCETGEDYENCPQDCPAAVCGNDICEAGEDSENCPQDCPAPPVEITAEDALAAISAATDAITTARSEEKDVTEAAALLTEAITAYNRGEFAAAKDKADAALASAQAAPPAVKPVELPITYILLGILILAALGGGAYLFKRGGRERRARKVAPPAPKGEKV